MSIRRLFRLAAALPQEPGPGRLRQGFALAGRRESLIGYSDGQSLAATNSRLVAAS
jgi:hypothetical protein